MKSMGIAPRLLMVCLVAAMAGCRRESPPEGQSGQGRRHIAQRKQKSALPQSHAVLPNGESLPAEIQHLLQLREADDKTAYIRKAREFLSTNRNDLIAADVATLYAQMRMTNEIISFGMTYANNSPARLLEFADIANNESWNEVTAIFARETSRMPNASYAELFRAARFIVEDPGVKFDTILERLESLAEKRYQKEDLKLLTCEHAVLSGNTMSETTDVLSQLATDAMMPQVRRDASRLLSEIAIKNISNTE